MKRLKRLLGDSAFHWLLFGLAMIGFCWPFFGGRDPGSSGRVFIYLFVIWAVVIIGLFGVARSLGRDNKGNRPGRKDPR